MTPQPDAEPKRRKRRKYKMQYRVYFDGQAPAFGDGYRGVAVVKAGYKWVRLVEIGSGYFARVSRAKWDEMRKQVVKNNKLTGEVVY